MAKDRCCKKPPLLRLFVITHTMCSSTYSQFSRSFLPLSRPAFLLIKSNFFMNTNMNMSWFSIMKIRIRSDTDNVISLSNKCIVSLSTGFRFNIKSAAKMICSIIFILYLENGLVTCMCTTNIWRYEDAKWAKSVAWLVFFILIFLFYLLLFNLNML